ncbi:hypothetical protein [Microbacterium murale]|uniref:ABC-type nickel/cobalt efflux system permease component RcnA n=1 Tax=Microbacterium murale TaxID=1081040 RepID=A0ABU0PA12_9MICO|nr:hypothetical protein [Microbacterium murale]MDQ0643526.1 ABC-type nickel/cobalt efflux system permease component RcnA [Microbacterium murale]
MSYSLNGSSNDHRVDELRRQHQQRQTRFFVTFGLVEGLALAAAAILIFVLGLIDPEQGIWVLIGIAAVGAFILSTSLMSMIRRHAREMRDLTGR